MESESKLDLDQAQPSSEQESPQQVVDELAGVLKGAEIENLEEEYSEFLLRKYS